MLDLGSGIPATGPRRAGGAALSVSAFSRLRARMIEGEDATVFVNADSTGYSLEGPFPRLALAIGALHDASVILHRWAEWEDDAPTGPLDYAAPLVLRSGAGPTLSLYLAALPGAMAGYMLADIRAAAFDIPEPDLAILHHGNNMQTFEVPGGLYAPGRAAFLGPLGMTALKWPGVPQLVTTQAPWRDSEAYDKVRRAIREIGATVPGLTVVDTHQALVAVGKAPGYYRDNIHPSDTVENATGAQCLSDMLLAAYRRASPSLEFATSAWPLLPADNLLANGDFNDWGGAVPAGWSVAAPGTVSKDTTVTFDGSFAHSLALRPNGSQNSNLFRYIRNAEATAMIGRTISFALLYRNSMGQRAPYVTLVVKSGGGVRTIVCSALQFGGSGAMENSGWMWATADGIAVDPDVSPTGYEFYLRVNAGFGAGVPESNEPLHIQRVVIVEGSLPRGGLGL